MLELGFNSVFVYLCLEGAIVFLREGYFKNPVAIGENKNALGTAGMELSHRQYIIKLIVDPSKSGASFYCFVKFIEI
jgi:hypothetical protein